MSTQATTWAFEQEGLSSGAKFLLVAIADIADAYGVGFPGRALLADRCACTSKTVSENLSKLEAAGLIARRERRRRNGSRTSDWIVLAPNSGDRGMLRDAPSEEYPGYIAEVARRGSGNETSPRSGNEMCLGQVTFSGRPEPSEEPSEESSPSGEPKSSAVAEVFEHWRGAMSPGARLTQDKRRKIQARLSDGYDVATLKRAVDGCAGSDFHMGREVGKPQKHNSIDLIFRNGSNVERFAAMADDGGSGSKYAAYDGEA
jgi:hypothetical protein